MKFKKSKAKCLQCKNENGYRVDNVVTDEAFFFCSSCGRVEKKIIREDKETTRIYLEAIKAYYYAFDYTNALKLAGYDEEIIEEFAWFEKKAQVQRLISHPLRAPMRTNGTYEYDIIIKRGFGTYRIKDSSGGDTIGRFVDERHREFKTNELLSNYDLYDENTLLLITHCDGNEKLIKIV